MVKCKKKKKIVGFKILKPHSGLKRPQSAILILTIWGFFKVPSMHSIHAFFI